MPCTNCNQSSIVPVSITGSFFQGSPCFNVEGCSGGTDGKCVYYNGPRLTCLDIDPLDSLEFALQKMDEKVCSALGDYSTYNMHCLPDWYGANIINQATFVDAITGYACQTVVALQTFRDFTFAEYQANINIRISEIEVPGISCASADVETTDGIQLVLTKYCSKFIDIDDALDISGVTWDACFTVIDPPTNIADGFQVLADQICSIQSAASSLPTFDNTGTCLGGGSNDSLVATIGLMKDRLCASPLWDATNLSWGCVGAPVSSTDIEEAIQIIVNTTNDLLTKQVTFDGSDFVVTQEDSGDPCAGVHVALATPINQDRFVAATAGDASPGTLQTKLIEGTGINLDFSNPVQVTISADGTADTFEVKANTADTTPGFLDEKINGSSSSGVSLDSTYNGGTEQLDLNLNVDLDVLFDALLDRLIVGSDLYVKFCAKVAGCPSPCDAPTNVQAVPGNSPTTSTTTLP